MRFILIVGGVLALAVWGWGKLKGAVFMEPAKEWAEELSPARKAAESEPATTDAPKPGPGATVKEANVVIPNAGRFTILIDPTGAEIAIWEDATDAHQA